MKTVDLFGEEVLPTAHKSTLGENWDYPPFSVLNAREGWWQERKRAWLSLGIKSELGRGENLSAMGGQSNAVRTSSGGGAKGGGLRHQERTSDLAEGQAQ